MFLGSLQVGIKPIPLKWDARDPKERGPVVASRHPNSLVFEEEIDPRSSTVPD